MTWRQRLLVAGLPRDNRTMERRTMDTTKMRCDTCREDDAAFEYHSSLKSGEVKVKCTTCKTPRRVTPPLVVIDGSGNRTLIEWVEDDVKIKAVLENDAPADKVRIAVTVDRSVADRWQYLIKLLQHMHGADGGMVPPKVFEFSVESLITETEHQVPAAIRDKLFEEATTGLAVDPNQTSIFDAADQDADLAVAGVDDDGEDEDEPEDDGGGNVIPLVQPEDEDVDGNSAPEPFEDLDENDLSDVDADEQPK
jgi:hypothetical protein